MNKINENKKTETKRKVGKSGFYAGVSATSWGGLLLQSTNRFVNAAKIGIRQER